VAALSLLLAGGLYFHGPWKVLTLIAIILATLTIVPKPIRKWVWACFSIIVVILVIWVFLPDNNEDWKPYTLNEERAQLEAKYAVADEDNAALIYDRLIETFDANDFRPEFMDDDLDDLIRNQPWSTKDYPQMAKWLKTHEKTIATLTEAAAKEKCHFPIITNVKEFSEKMRRLSPMKRWAELLIFAINNDIGDGRSEQALEKNLIPFQMGRHLCQQTTLIELLVGIAVDAMSMMQFNIFIVEGDPTEAQLDLIDKKLTENEHNWSSDFIRILECENLRTKNTVLGILYEVDGNGNTRFSRDPTTTIQDLLWVWPQTKRDLLQGYWQTKMFKAYAILAWFWVPTNPQTVVEIINNTKREQYAKAEDDFDWGKEQKLKVFSYTSIPPNFHKMLNNYSKSPCGFIHELYLRAISNKQATRIMIALRRYKNEHNQWPESLEDIKSLAPAEIFVDPINDGDYVYKLTDENFTLYSRGKNGIDEDGVRYAEKPDGTRTDDIVFWPRKR
jgi:hypothetical protein